MGMFPGLTFARKRWLQLEYLQWVASSRGPREATYLKRFTPSPLLLRVLRMRSALLKQSPPSRDVFFVIPTAAVKARTVRRHAEIYGLSTFVETGTFRGDMVAAVADAFSQCITIELSEKLWHEARSRFDGRPSVKCICGDSSVALQGVLDELDGGAVFWLDAHASGGITADSGSDPILAELHTIFSRKNPRDVILIDDARGHELDTIGNRVPPSHRFLVRNDIIRITPIR